MQPSPPLQLKLWSTFSVQWPSGRGRHLNNRPEVVRPAIDRCAVCIAFTIENTLSPGPQPVFAVAESVQDFEFWCGLGGADQSQRDAADSRHLRTEHGSGV